MATINTTVDFDYISGQYKIAAISDSLSVTGWSNTTAAVYITSPKGYLMSPAIPVTVNDNNYQGWARGYATGAFGFNLSDVNTIEPSNNKLYYSDYSTSLKLSASTTLSLPIGSVIELLETGTYPTYSYVSKVNNVYNGVPILINRGDSAPHFLITGVSNKNQVYYGNTSLTTYQLTGHNYNDCIGQVLNGSASGTKFFVTDYTQGTSKLTIDRDASTWSGALIRLSPYRTITAYSGWLTYTGQAGGLRSEFTLNSSIPTGVGNLKITGATYSTAGLDVGTILGLAAIGTTTNVSYISIPATGIVNLLDIQAGDIFEYKASGTLGTTYGTIVTNPVSGVPAAGSYSFAIYPTGNVAASPNNTGIIHRNNQYTLLTYPEFDTSYEITTVVGTALSEVYRVKTPSASLEITANEFDSTYGTVGDMVHFHVGPVHLSNGTVLPQNYLLRYDVAMYQGDVTSTTPITTWKSHGTMTTDIGTVNNGQYMKRGMYTATYAQALNSSETLMFDITGGIGSAKITKVVTIPVQPSA